MKKILFVINPISGIGKQNILESLIPQYIDANKFEYEIAYTNAPKHLIEICKNAAQNNLDAVIVAGGDGSVNEATIGLVNNNTALGIIPTGSGNGLARHLKLPLKLKEALQKINDFNITKIDTVKFNDSYFANIAGFGFDAHIAHEFANYGKRGFSSYIKIVLKELPKFKKTFVKITTPDFSISQPVFMVSIANGSQFGNDAVIAPNAITNDGLMNLIIIKKINLFTLPFLAYKMFRGKLSGKGDIIEIKAKKIEIELSDIKKCHCDGEPKFAEQKNIIEIEPLSLNIII